MEKRRDIYAENILPDDRDVEKARRKYNFESDIPKDVIRRLCDNDHNAFNTIYLHFSRGMISYLQKYLGNRESAEEIYQDVFAKIWERRNAIDPDKGIKGLVYKMAIDAVYDQFKRRNVKQKFDSYHFAYDQSDHAPDQYVITEEIKVIMEIALSRMPEKRRRIFEMSRAEGLSHEEIAQREGISKSLVNHHISAVIKELKELLALCIVIMMN